MYMLPNVVIIRLSCTFLRSWIELKKRNLSRNTNRYAKILLCISCVYTVCILVIPFNRCFRSNRCIPLILSNRFVKTQCVCTKALRALYQFFALRSFQWLSTLASGYSLILHGVKRKTLKYRTRLITIYLRELKSLGKT